MTVMSGFRALAGVERGQSVSPWRPRQKCLIMDGMRARTADLAHSRNTRNAPEREHRSSAPERRAVAPWDSARSAPLAPVSDTPSTYRSTARCLGGVVGWPMAATTLCE
jgi:hypothetical protein